MIAAWYPLSHDTNLQTCHCLRPLSLASLASSPIGRAKGGCAAGFALCYPLRWAGNGSTAPTSGTYPAGVKPTAANTAMASWVPR